MRGSNPKLNHFTYRNQKRFSTGGVAARIARGLRCSRRSKRSNRLGGAGVTFSAVSQLKKITTKNAKGAKVP
jgi:hypothetical protein